MDIKATTPPSRRRGGRGSPAHLASIAGEVAQASADQDEDSDAEDDGRKMNLMRIILTYGGIEEFILLQAYSCAGNLWAQANAA